MSIEELEKTVRDLSGALLAVQAQLMVETTINTGITLALVRAGLVTPTVIETIRSVGAQNKGVIYAEHLSNRLESLHALAKAHGPTIDSPRNFDA